jgi:hypothetical protein
MQKIIQNATVEYHDGIKETFEALQVVERGVFIGRMRPDDETNTPELFIYGFIPRTSIRQITNGDKKAIQW